MADAHALKALQQFFAPRRIVADVRFEEIRQCRRKYVGRRTQAVAMITINASHQFFPCGRRLLRASAGITSSVGKCRVDPAIRERIDSPPADRCCLDRTFQDLDHQSIANMTHMGKNCRGSLEKTAQLARNLFHRQRKFFTLMGVKLSALRG